MYTIYTSETKAKSNESFYNDVFFDIEVKRTPSIISKLFSKRSEHFWKNKKIFKAKLTRSIVRNYFKSEVNTSDNTQIIFRSEANTIYEKELFSKRSEHIRQ